MVIFKAKGFREQKKKVSETALDNFRHLIIMVTVRNAILLSWNKIHQP